MHWHPVLSLIAHLAKYHAPVKIDVKERRTKIVGGVAIGHEPLAKLNILFFELRFKKIYTYKTF